MTEYKVIVDSNNSIRWYKPNTNELHRLDGPAVEFPTGTKIWFVDGKKHRLDGPAYEGGGGDKEWYINGNLHRLDGPAYEGADGDKEWWVDDKRHRLDGPSRVLANGDKEWWVDDKEYTEAEFIAKTQTKELTLAEISALLGYDVKIIK